MNRPIIILLTAAFGLMCVACGSSYKEKQRITAEQRQAQAREDSASLKIAVVPTMDCLPLFIGVEDSLFSKAGINVHLRMRPARLDCDTLIARGHVEGFVTDLIHAERLRNHGTPLHYATATNAYWQVIANRKSRVTNASQLSDKMIAITRFSATSWLADRCLEKAHPKYDVFRVQINDVHVRLNMLLNNEIDALVFTEPQATTARLYKNAVLADSRDLNTNLGVIAFTQKAYNNKDRKKQIDTFLRVYDSVCDSINRFGLTHYNDIIQKYTDADAKTLKALPKLKYTHTAAPRQKDIDTARKYLK